jgi:hypothetical protein
MFYPVGFLNTLSVLCLSAIILSWLLAGLTWRALTERDDLRNEYGYLRWRLIWYVVSVTLWCVGIQFLFLITFPTLRLILTEHSVWAENITWAALAIYPINILTLYGGVYWKLKRLAPFSEIAPYLRLAVLGVLPTIGIWITVFFIWNLLN